MQHNRQRDRMYVYPAPSPDESPLFVNLDYREIKYLGAADIR
jgi:hypothetical protein